MPRPEAIRALLDSLPDEALVLDVGGWAEPDPRADWVIDIGSFETRGWYGEPIGKGNQSRSDERFNSKTWVVADICGPDRWPFPDRMFDFVVCAHTLEDVRDPIFACREMARVARSGYIETPAAAVELTRGIESPRWCGWRHHRWLVETDDAGLVFISKPHHIHDSFWPAIRSPRFLLEGAGATLEFQWQDALSAREAIEVRPDESDALLFEIARRAARPDPRGSALRGLALGTWRFYRTGRGVAGSLIRRR